LDLLAQTFSGNEFVILSTCNRVELYVASDSEQVPNTANLTDTLATVHGIESEAFAPYLISYSGKDAIGHLFRVAASLESLVVGEGQILGQVRDAYQIATDHKAVGPIFHAVFQSALRVGKLVRQRTGMDQGKLSVASVAVDLAKDVFDSFADKTVLVIGTGKMGELTLRHLKGLNPGKILVANRDLNRATMAATAWNGQVVPFEQLPQALIEADLVITTTAAIEPIVTLDQYVQVQRARRNRLALILDIAIPRDFDPRIGNLQQVTLYHIDDLRLRAEQNRLQRQKGVDPALTIIEREASDCYARLCHQQDAGLLLQQLGNQADQICQRELATLFTARPNLTEADRHAVTQMALRLQNQFLHHPRAAVRSAFTQPVPSHTDLHPVFHFVRHIFGLGERSPNSLKKI
jgi:glutamyl-tRNA reductase